MHRDHIRDLIVIGTLLIVSTGLSHAQTTQLPQAPVLVRPASPQVAIRDVVPVFIVWREGEVTGAGLVLQPDLRFTEPDHDGDGVRAIAHGGTDCDDNDPRTYPGNPEVPDTHDEDCDPFSIGILDEDGDGFVSWRAMNIMRTASGLAYAVSRGPDCDDQRRDVNPNVPEITGDLRDNNCDGVIDLIEPLGHREYCAPISAVSSSQVATPCGQPSGNLRGLPQR